MKISATVENSKHTHKVIVSTNTVPRELHIAPRAEGFGSSVNGGELLFLALGTCYCNDLYREAAKLGIAVHAVEVIVEGEFGGAGECAKNIRYRAKVKAEASHEQIELLMRQTDQVAEVQNTLRQGIQVKLEDLESVAVA